MSQVNGTVFNATNGKPIAGANVILSTSDAMHPIESDITDSVGKYSIDNPATDDPNAMLYISADGYGGAAVTPGNNAEMYQTSFISISKIPTWLWIVIAIAAIGAIYFFILKNKMK